jgi:hypothetical protein
MTQQGISGSRLIAGALVFAFCCVADLFVVRSAWTGRQIVEGQFRRGYFERFNEGISLAVDDVIRPVFPSCVLMDDGALAVPPGMSAVVPLGPGTAYELASDSAFAPYVLLAAEAPVEPIWKNRARSGEARLVGGRTLSLRDGNLELVKWNPARPWREDAASLSALRAACTDGVAPPALTVRAGENELRLDFGRCSFTEVLPSRSAVPPQLAALAGPDWITLTRRPGWDGERWFVWPVVAIVAAKIVLSCWGVGLVSTAALSGLLGGMAFVMPVAAMLTWPLTLIIGAAAAFVRGALLVLRLLPSRWRAPAALAVVALVGGAIVMRPSEPRQFPPIVRTDESQRPPDACAVVGYSAAGGASLRGGYGGVSAFLNQDCEPCRDQTGNLTAGGQTLDWARDAYCASESSFGADGQVIFFGGANDDFLSGLTSMARLFIVGEQGIEPWRRSQAPAAAASLARIDSQASALQGLMRCAQERQAGFLFLHDFLVTDMVTGRDADRATMLARRRASVEESGGRFVDVLDVFATEAGVSWFNDYVHPSAIAHERIAELACRLVP